MMINREESYTKALAIKNEDLRRRTALREKQVAEISAKNSRVGEIERRIGILGSEVAITALSGDTDALRDLQDAISALSAEKAEILKQAGLNEVSYECDVCRDTGYVSGKLCACVHSIAKRLRLAAFSSEFPIDECRFENFNLNYYPESDKSGANPRKRMTNILKLCREYVINFKKGNEPPQNLLFMGEAGLGKTHLTLAMVYELIERGFDVIYGSAYNLFSAMENERFSYKGNDSYTAAIECDLLVIDDLGSEFVTPFIQTLVYNIINTRLLSKKPVIISTNLSMQEIEKKYTPRVSSRLIGNYVAKRFAGKDIRQLKMIEKS